MRTAIELANQRKVELSYLQTVGQVLADSHYFNDAHTAQQAVAKILAGQEFGMGVMEAMRSFHVIDGKVEMSADAQARLLKESSKYDYAVLEITDEKCSIQFYADDLGEIGTSTFTMADAERAGIVKSEGAWKKYPRNMLFARALTNGVAWFCPDAISGGRVYAPGEIGSEQWDAPEASVIEIPSDLEPVEGSAASSVTGMGEGGGSSEVAENTGAATEDPTREGSFAYGEGADGPSDTSDSPAPPAGTEGEGSSPAGGSVEPLKSTQRKQLLRHAVDLRWNDADIAAAVDEAYPGITAIADLSQEQARALIVEWSKFAKAVRIRPEQKERLKPLASNTDAVRRAQVLFGADFIKNLSDLTIAEAEALIADLETTRQEVSA